MNSDAPEVVLKRYGAELQPIGPVEPLGGNGGLSGSRLWRYASATGPRLLRSWPEGRTRERIETIHRWLREAADLPFIPQPSAALDGRTVLAIDGLCWEASPWLPGAADPGRPPRVEVVREAFRTLGLFHARTSRLAILGPSPGLLLRAEELQRLASGGFDAIEFALNAHLKDPCQAPAREWLTLARSLAPKAARVVEKASRLVSPVQPCLRDARPEHFLFDDGRVVGLVDFGAMDVENPSADLARLVGEWLPAPECASLRAEGIAAYAATTSLDPNHFVVAEAFEIAADVLIGERWIRWRFRDRRRFDDPNAVADGIARGLARLRRSAASLIRSPGSESNLAEIVRGGSPGDSGRRA